MMAGATLSVVPCGVAFSVSPGKVPAAAIDVPDPSLEEWGRKRELSGEQWKLSKAGRCWADGAHQGKYCALIHSTADTERCCLQSAGLPEIEPGMTLRVAFFARWLKGDHRVWVGFEERASYPMVWYPLWPGLVPKDGQWHCLQADVKVPQIPEDVVLRLSIGIPQPTQKSHWTKPTVAIPDTEYLIDDISLAVLQPGRTVVPKRSVASSFVSGDARDNPSPYGVFWTPWRTYCGVPISSPHDYDKTHDEILQELDLMQRIGVKWVRSIWRWDKIEWRKGQCDFALLDFVVAEAWRRDIRIVPALATPPRWASTAPEGEPAFRVYPPRLSDWAAFVARLVDHFRQRIKYWEVWNEPNVFSRWKGTVEDYYRLQKATFTAARGVDPNSKILLGAFSQSGFVYLDRLLGLGAKDYFDVLSCHPYPRQDGLNRIEYMVRRLRLVLADHGCEDRSIWFTEAGWKAQDVGGAGERIRRLGELYSRPFDGAVEKRFWFLFDSWDSRPVEEGHSLVRFYQGQLETGSAYHAYARITGNSTAPE